MLKNISGSVRPETESQAASWERVKVHALAFGLCTACAAQLAWGHSAGGFSSIHPPCASCAAAVRRLPVEKPNGWRTVAGVASSRRAWASLSAVDGAGLASTPGEAVMPVHRARAARDGGC